MPPLMSMAVAVANPKISWHAGTLFYQIGRHSTGNIRRVSHLVCCYFLSGILLSFLIGQPPYISVLLEMKTYKLLLVLVRSDQSSYFPVALSDYLSRDHHLPGPLAAIDCSPHCEEKPLLCCPVAT